MKTNETRYIRWYHLVALYLLVSCLRYVLALLTSAYPTVAIDEYLYYSLARSIAGEGTLLFKGQAANYAYILYPLVLSPVYALFPQGADYFRIMQAVNILIMTASLFPLFCLGRDMLSNDRRAFVFALFAVLLPDMILGQKLFSEALIYPLFYTLLWCAWQYSKTSRPAYLYISGLLGALLYWAKPGAALPFGMLMVFVLVGAWRGKAVRRAVDALISIGVFAAVFLGFWLLAGALGYKGGLLSVYSFQLAGGSRPSAFVFIKAIAGYICLFTVACGVFGVVYPISACRKWAQEHKRFAVFALACLAGTIIGTAWAVNMTEFSSDTMHLRYLGMYFPLPALFCLLSIGEHSPKRKLEAVKKKAQKNSRPEIAAVLALLIFTAVMIFIVPLGSEKSNASCYPFLSLSLLVRNGVPQGAVLCGRIFTALVCVVGAYVFTCLEESRKVLPRVAVALMALFMLANSIYDYTLLRGEVEYPCIATKEQLVETLGDEDYVYVYSHLHVPDKGLDVSQDRSVYQVSLKDLFNHLYPSNGRYEPFVPEVERGVYSVTALPDTDILVFEKSAFDMLIPSADTELLTAPDAPGLAAVRQAPGKRMFDSAVGGVSAYELEAGSMAILSVYNEELLKKPLHIRFRISSPAAQKLNIHSTSEVQSIDLEKGSKWYDIVFSQPEDTFNFSVEDAQIRLFQYEIMNNEK